MEQELISKKELLELTGISYGQLYRWKRKDLIPEDWFIRKSTYTGQETFFPKSKILKRIDKILNKKDGVSLDELAELLSSSPAELALYREELLNRNIVSQISFDFFVEQQGDAEVFTFEKVLALYILDKLLQTGEINLDEGNMVLDVLRKHFVKFANKPYEIIFLRKMGMSSVLLISSPSDVYFEEGTKVIARLNIAECIQELKFRIT